MYLPPPFRETRPGALAALIRDYNFGTLVTHGPEGLAASHLPFLYDPERGPHGTLRAHMARANPQWPDFAGGEEALAIFQGPHAYVSPSWYTVSPAVPTWNYAVVHAYGVPRVIDDEGLRALLEELVRTHEAGFAAPWRFDSLPDEYVERQARAIVGFEIPVTRLEGKFKLNQNRSEADHERVIAALSDASDSLRPAVGEMMREWLRAEK